MDTHSEVHFAARSILSAGCWGRGVPRDGGRVRLPAGLAGKFGDVALVGVEGTGSYGAGLTRYLAARGIRVVEVDRADRQERHRNGKSDPLTRSAPPALPCPAGIGRAEGPRRGSRGDPVPDGRQAQRPARASQAVNQARALILTGPNELRARFAGKGTAALAEAVAALRPRPGAACYPLRVALRELGRRVQFLDGQIARLDELIVPLVTARAPGLLALHGVGPDTAALLLTAARTTRNGCAARPPGPTCAPPPRSPPPRARPAGTGSTAAGTARPTTPCGASSSPG